MAKMINAIWFLLAAALWVPATATAEPADEFKSCARCHGQEGNSAKSSSPSISGFSAEYLVHVMKEYRDGKRECATMKLKCKLAAKWSDEEITRSAQHFAQFERVAPEQTFDEALAVTGQAIHEEKCAGCHGAKASATADSPEGGLLNGQWREYLEYVLEEYANGGRQQPDKMRSALESLDDTQKDALLNYFASGR